jgi:hypothetical protein
VTHKEAVKPGYRNGQVDLDQRLAQFFERDGLARFPDRENVRAALTRRD